MTACTPPRSVPPALAGSEWAPQDMPDAFVRFEAEGVLVANAGCNALRSTYEQLDNLLLIQPIAATRKMCAPDVMEREARLIEALQRSHHAAIKDDGKLGLLVIKNYDGRPLLTLQRSDWD